MTSLTQLTRRSGGLRNSKDPTYPGWDPRGPGLSSTCAGRGGKDDSNIAPFHTTRLAAYTHLLSNVMPSKHFLSHLILTLRWCLKYKISSRWEKFAPSYNPLFRVTQITIQVTARIARNTTHFSPLYGGTTLSMTWATQAAWDWYELSTPRCDSRMANPLTVVEGMQAVSSRPLPQWGKSGMSAKHALQAQSWRANAFQASRQVSKNLELFKKLEPGTQIHWERISPSNQLSRFSRGSEMEPSTSPRYSFFRDKESSLDRGRFRIALWQSLENSVPSLGLQRPSALGLDLRGGKASLTLGPHTVFVINDQPRQASDSRGQASLDTLLENTDGRPAYRPTYPKEFGKGLFQCRPMIPRQR